jgi:diaminopimelate decarboxylase
VALAPADVVGPVCETGDFFALGRPLDEVRRGDLLLVRGTGAYGASMSSEYNARPRAAEVLVDGGVARVVRPRGRVEDLHPVPGTHTSHG